MLYLALYRWTVELPAFFVLRIFVGEDRAKHWVRTASNLWMGALAILIVLYAISGGPDRANA